MPQHLYAFKIPSCLGCQSQASSDELHVSVLAAASQANTLDKDPTDASDVPTACLAAFMTSPSTFRSPATARRQLQERFFYIYFPAGDHDTDFFCSRFLSMESIQAGNTWMTAAVDALSLLQLGTSFDDKDLFDNAVQQYSMAVASVRLDPGKPKAIFDDDILIAMYVLGFRERYAVLATNGFVRRTHHAGLRETLIHRGPCSTYSPLARLLLYNVRYLAVVHGLADRKRVACADPAWKRCMTITSSLMTELTNLLSCVPALLQGCDTFKDVRKKGQRRPIDVLVDISVHERELKAWHLPWLRSFQGLPYWTTSISHFDHFHKYHPDAARIFPKAYFCPSFSSASAQTSYWSTLLQIKQAILQLGRLKGCGSNYAIRGRISELVEEANECAMDLCRSAAWLTQPTYGSCGLVRSSSPLRYAARWFAAQTDVKRVKWCVTVETNITASGLAFHSGEYLDYPAMSDSDDLLSDDSSSST